MTRVEGKGQWRGRQERLRRQKEGDGLEEGDDEGSKSNGNGNKGGNDEGEGVEEGDEDEEGDAHTRSLRIWTPPLSLSSKR